MNYIGSAVSAYNAAKSGYSKAKEAGRMVKEGYRTAKRLKRDADTIKRKLRSKSRKARSMSSKPQASLAAAGPPVGDAGFSRRRSGRGKRGKVSLSKQVKDLQRKVGNGIGQLHYIATTYSSIGSAVNAVAYDSFMVGITSLQSIFGSILILDEDSPATPQFINPTAATFSQKLRVKQFMSCFTIRNNSLGPIQFSIYAVRPKRDTSITPGTAVSNGFADNPGGALTVASVDNWPSDSNQFTTLWKTVNSWDVYLNPGETKEYWVKTGPFSYDPSVFDSHAQEYQNKYGSHGFLTRIQGVIAHDSAVKQNVGYSTGTADWEFKTHAYIEYEAGMPIKYKVVSSGADSITTATIATDEDAVAENPATA